MPSTLHTTASLRITTRFRPESIDATSPTDSSFAGKGGLCAVLQTLATLSRLRRRRD